MGKTYSKVETSHNGDPQVKIINNQELHSEALQSNEVSIWSVLLINIIQLIITAYELLNKRINRRAVKIAKSLNDINA